MCECGLARSGVASFIDVAGHELTDHHATAHVACEPEDQENNQYKTEQSAAIVWGAPPGTTAVIVPTASTEEEDQNDNQEDQHDVPVSVQVLGRPRFAHELQLSMR